MLFNVVIYELFVRFYGILKIIINQFSFLEIPHWFDILYLLNFIGFPLRH